MRWLPTPKARPNSSATAASRRLISSPRRVPPVIGAIISGARSARPAMAADKSSVASDNSGSASFSNS